MFNYVYDIQLNFHEKYYDFYDWYQEDRIMHFKKIPIFRIDRNTMDNFLKNDFIINDSFLRKIENEANYFDGLEINRATSFIVINSGMVLAIQKCGSKFLKSSLLLEEQDGILELEADLPQTKIPFEVKRINKIELLTRNQAERCYLIKEKIKQLIKENNVEKLKYIYFEIFNEQEENLQIIKTNLKRMTLDQIKRFDETFNNLESEEK